MRRIFIAIVIISIALFASTQAFAFKTNTGAADANKDNNKAVETQETRALNAQIRDLNKQVAQNKQKLTKLKNQSFKACNAAKIRIFRLQNKKLKKEQVDSLQDDTTLLKQYITELNSINTDIDTKKQILEDAKSQNNLELVIQTLNEIIESQQDRISRLEEIIQGVNQIARL